MSQRTRLYVDAVRHMRASQLAGRARRLISPQLLAAGLRAPTRAEFARAAAGLGAPIAPQSGAGPDPAAVGAFVAYGRSRRFPDDGFWRPGPEGPLYLFHLHGFERLAGYAAGTTHPAGDRFWAQVVESWLESHARPSLPAWHPYPTSRRLAAWCSALGALGGWPETLRAGVAGEIERQAAYLRRAVEHDIGGNHVLTNATGLVFAGVTVPSSGALDFGLRLMCRELSRQILADGGHEERSTSYQREIDNDLGAVIELLRRSGRQAPPTLAQTRGATTRWLGALAGPDHRLPMLNDAWEGPPVHERADEPMTLLEPSGYVALRADGDQAVIDCGPLCPPHLPPHAHADALSFVLWIDGRPLIVDPGAYAYTGPDRAVFRATAAHNTVEVDGADQCVFWGDFRAGLLPRVHGPWVRTIDGVVVVEGSHDGYRRLPDPTVHHRAFLWAPGAGLVIVDRLHCRAVHQVRSNLQLAPGVAMADGVGGGLTIKPLAPGGSATIETSAYAPFLGRRVPTAALVARHEAGPGIAFGWSLLRAGADAQLAPNGAVELRRDAGAGPIRIGLRGLG